MRFAAPLIIPILPFGAVDQGYATARVTSPFGWRDLDGDGKATEFHGGLDIGNARQGDVLVAPAPGTVIAVGNLTWPWSQPTQLYPSGNYGGLMVVIEHEPGVVSIFAHMRMTTVVRGQKVMTGQKVGEIGATGMASVGGAHVHFGIQAPAARVPAGVQTRVTPYGYGLDVDPWPFITGAADLLPVPKEDDVQLKGKFKRHVHNARASLTSDANFRSGVETGDMDPLHTFAKGTIFYPFAVVGGVTFGTAPDKDEWYATLQWIEGVGYAVGYYHSSVLPRTADASGVALDSATPPQIVEKVVVDETRINQIKQKTAAFAADIAND